MIHGITCGNKCAYTITMSPASTVNNTVLKHHWVEKDGGYADNR